MADAEKSGLSEGNSRPKLSLGVPAEADAEKSESIFGPPPPPPPRPGTPPPPPPHFADAGGGKVSVNFTSKKPARKPQKPAKTASEPTIQELSEKALGVSADIDVPAVRHPYQARASARRALKARVAERARTAVSPTVSPEERKNRAIARALAAVQPIEAETDVLAKNVSAPQSAPELTTTHSKRVASTPSVFSAKKRLVLALAVAVIAVGALGLLIANSIPDISLQVVAMQVGIDAVYPAYIPRDFSLSSVSREENQIRLNFAGADGGFTLTEEHSSWDAVAVLNNYVKVNWGDDYVATHENGITVYISGSNAAWVNGNIFYTLSADGDLLTKKQITSIVAGLS